MQDTINILIIDDNPADLNIFKRYLNKIKDFNVHLTMTDNSEDGFKLCNNEKFDVIFIDYLLGNENGIDIIKKFKDLGCKSEYILLTGYGSEAVVADALRAGASDYLKKNTISVPILEKTLKHISQKIFSEQKIKKTESKLNYILERTYTGLAILDEQGRIEEANQSYLEMIGFSSMDNIIGRSILEWTAESCKTDVVDIIEKCKRDENIIDFEAIFDRPDGTQTHVSMNGFMEIEEGKPRILLVCKDITERKKYEHQLKQAKVKAEESDHLKSAFLANMSHEIRTPMNAIIGFTDLLSQPNLTEAERDEYIKIIKQSSADLLNLIDDIIDLAKIEVEKINIKKNEFLIEPVMLSVYNKFSKQKQSCVELNYVNKQKNENNESVTINTDAYRFTQILSNLIDNALKFTESGFVNFGYELKDKYIQFYVKDTGIGIPKEKQEIIFKRFRKIEDSNTKFYRGTGLGLTISKKLVELLGGKMWLESEPGKGSTFYFTLPHTVKKAVAYNPGKSEKPDIEKLDWSAYSLLIVEDEDLNYLFLKKLLETTKIKIDWAKTGYQAIDFVKNNNKTDIILMDIKLPELDGLKATEEIKKINPSIPIIAQTAYAMKGDRENILNAGCDDYVAKPIKVDELIFKLNNYLGS